MIESSLYVAKQFFETGSGTVTAQDNADFLTQEFIRLKQGQWFWSQFRILAKDKGVDIGQGKPMLPIPDSTMVKSLLRYSDVRWLSDPRARGIERHF